MQEYKPNIPKRKLEKIKAWHKEAIKSLYSSKPINVNVLGIEIAVNRGVFPPTFPDSTLLAEAIVKEVNRSDIVLDIGTGTGVHAILAAQKAKNVIATDINSFAIENAKENISNNGLSKKIQIIKSDLFDNVKEKFDLIILNPPFRWFSPNDKIEKAETDENYQSLQKFFIEAKNYLTKNGRILMAFSDSGDIDFFESLIDKNGYKKEILAEENIDGWLYKIYRLRV
jgi:release factor glutamine methyltransferase